MADSKGTKSPPHPPPPPAPTPPPPAIVVEPAEKVEHDKAGPKAGDHQAGLSSDQQDFQERKRSLIVGDDVHVEPPPVKKKWEKDFFICNGIIFTCLVALVIALVVLMLTGGEDGLKNKVGRTREKYLT